MPKNAPTVTQTVLPADQWTKRVALGGEFMLIKKASSPAETQAVTRKQDTATVLMKKMAVAMKTPGIDRGAIFRGPNPQKVYAYSALPGDITRLVRESQDGKRDIGKMGADGKFRISRKVA